MSNPTIHRGIHITRAEVPGAPYEWTHDETNAHGMAPDIETAIAQIDLHLGSPVPTSAASMPVTSTTPTVADLVAVKPLEWKGPDLEGDYMADHPFGWYETYHLDTCILLSKDGVDSGTFETLDAAKAAAEADYKARILSRLSPADLHDATAKQRDELAAVKPLEWEDFEGRGAIARAGRCESYLIDRWPDGRFWDQLQRTGVFHRL
ncbi:hypothetical protein [Paracoccus sp. (in: a-proteobacteria)]|uniref:hypothetical protein n=1 Tax=Paracoccus sp. TaxID=267 RepID=UPI002AFEA451|nr:hypothetical protein [Paracoccus sp. (in: a-proteobacteria)]